MLESEEDRHLRLLKVLASAEFTELTEVYVYEEIPTGNFPARVSQLALAFVHDGDGWSQLVPTNPERHSKEIEYKMFSFHFDPDGPENSGFVGWLASNLRRKTGTGVIVICGYNKDRGGVYDYWGCPVSHADRALREVRDLIEQGRSQKPRPSIR